MDLTGISELRNGHAAQGFSDDRMEQVRELLFGEQRRQLEWQISTLESRLRDIEISLLRRIEELEARFDAMVQHDAQARSAAFDELSRGIGELSTRIRGIARSE
jgi:hypothetical protein